MALLPKYQKHHTFSGMKTRLADFELLLSYNPDNIDFPYLLEASPSREAHSYTSTYASLKDLIPVLEEEERLAGEPDEPEVDVILTDSSFFFDGQNLSHPDGYIYSKEEALELGILVEKSAPPRINDDLMEITINGEQLVLPAGSTIKDAHDFLEKRDAIGTQVIDADTVDYILMLAELASDNNYILSVNQEAEDLPFRLFHTPTHNYIHYSTTSTLHQGLRKLASADD